MAQKLRARGGRPLPFTTPPERSVIRVSPLECRARTGEYYRIWLVNIALSILTLGVYLPWARVRMQRYLYGQTYLEGYNFQYLASPSSLLWGYALAGSLFFTFWLTRNLAGWQWLSVALALLFYALYPWMLYRSLRFRAHNTAYRGLCFGFGAGAGQAYLLFGLLPLTYGLSLGLTVPLGQHLQRRFLMEGLRYGGGNGSFRGDAGPVYLFYLLTLGGALLGGLLVLALWLLLRSAGHGWGWWLSVPLALIWLGAGQLLRAQLLRYTLEQAQLGASLRLRVRFHPLKLAWVLLSNLLAQLLTLGLATPWAAVRQARYLLHHVDVLSLAPLDSYAASGGPHERALGEAAAELFDIGVHL